MRRLGFYISLTADGMYADPAGGLDAFEPSEEEHRFAKHLVRDAGDVIIGRRMYEVMTYWDEVNLDDPATPAVAAEFAHFWREVVEAVRAMKSGDGPPIMLGAGADLVATLAGAGLIDDYKFLLVPTALGQGKALFGSLAQPLQLRLVGTRRFDSGSVLLEYVPA